LVQKMLTGASRKQGWSTSDGWGAKGVERQDALTDYGVRGDVMKVGFGAQIQCFSSATECF